MSDLMLGLAQKATEYARTQAVQAETDAHYLQVAVAVFAQFRKDVLPSPVEVADYAKALRQEMEKK